MSLYCRFAKYIETAYSWKTNQQEFSSIMFAKRQDFFILMADWEALQKEQRPKESRSDC
jgi:hypothetical protein